MSTQPQLARYHQLVQVLAALARSSRDVEGVVQTVHRQAQTLFSTHVTLLALLSGQGEWTWELYEGRQHTTSRLPFYPEGIVEQVLRGGPLSIPDLTTYLTEYPVRVRRVVSTDEVILDVRETEDEAESVHSLLLVPLETGGERVGVLSIQSYRTFAFDETDLLFLELLGQHVAIALENARWHAQLEQATLTDPLTALPNRRAFGERAQRALDAARAGEATTLVLVDVQRFKRINDTFGHDVGDEVLVTIAGVLGRALPPGAAFRLGGDEFALLLPGAGAGVSAQAAGLNAAFRAAGWPEGVGPVCLNAGAARVRPDDTLSTWLRRADQRMYRAKRGCADVAGSRLGLDFGPAQDGPRADGPPAFNPR